MMADLCKAGSNEKGNERGRRMYVKSSTLQDTHFCLCELDQDESAMPSFTITAAVVGPLGTELRGAHAIANLQPKSPLCDGKRGGGGGGFSDLTWSHAKNNAAYIPMRPRGEEEPARVVIDRRQAWID